MMIDTVELKKVLVDISDELRTRSKGLKQLPPALVGSITVVTTLLLWLAKYDKGDTDMDNLKRELTVKLVSLDDIPVRRRKSEIEEVILEKAAELSQAVEKVRQHNMVAPDSKKLSTPVMHIESGIRYQHLATKIKRLKDAKKLSEDFRVMKRGNDVYLAKG